ncbi:hypothetical protein PC129_g5336 [Phytophthora cactorum]|nr:hypothetical protein Pcac1_g15316 [Phytophthora cactorum]KAG2924410.1 hypothetical protein PC114_g4509 [Phytophthora cactorum]KAG2934470.1 hypothetical protein PC117_g12647 [Phytophthora cactorum]KAG3013677.1 hypothetical protein PC120_g13147 [Phytophthora cactorum]KAG3028334.1 hypothetical protein PC119_g7055 [Phytophthora cactorum]
MEEITPRFWKVAKAASARKRMEDPDSSPTSDTSAAWATREQK